MKCLKDLSTTGFLYPILLTLIASLVISGCSDVVGSNDSENSTLSLSISIPVSAAFATGKGGSGVFGLVLSDNSNTLEITSLGVVLSEIELERQDQSDCDILEEGTDDDECEEFEAGPILLSPMLDGSLEHIVEIDIPAGVYSELEFDIHKVEDSSEAEGDFLALHPEYNGLSIRVTGTFNDNAFVFTQDLNEEQEIEFENPLIIDENSGSHNVTIHLDLESWFRNTDGKLIDPASANDGGAFRGLVEANIKRSIEAFEDNDYNGKDDDLSEIEGFVIDDPLNTTVSFGGTLAGDFQFSISTDGILWVDVGSPNGITVTLQKGEAAASIHGAQSVPEGTYEYFRLIVSDVEISVSAGSLIDDVTFNQEIKTRLASSFPLTVLMTTAPVIVERNQKLEVYVDLNVEDWLSASEVQAGEVGLSAIEFDVAAVTR